MAPSMELIKIINADDWEQNFLAPVAPGFTDPTIDLENGQRMFSENVSSIRRSVRELLRGQTNKQTHTNKATDFQKYSSDSLF